MSDLYSKMFIQGLKKFDLNKIKKVPKSDLHNHFVLGGNRNYIKNKTGIDIYPIKEFYKSGLDVTINSDDILIFDSDVSKEYLKLYKNKVLTAEELDDIRLNGLKSIGNNKYKI